MTHGKKALVFTLMTLVLTACASKKMGDAMNLVEQMGGMEKLNQVSSSLLKNLQQDPRVSGLLGSVDMDKVTPMLTNQLCAALGGGCKAPLTADQIKAGASKLTPDQTTAVKEGFGKALDQSGVTGAAKTSVTSALGSQLAGILGGLI